MTARESAATERALALVNAGATISGAARAQGIAVTTLRRALRRRGVPPAVAPAGDQHHNYRRG